MDNPLRLIDEIEQLVEKGKGWMGKRFVNEEEFFTLIQRLKIALPQFLKSAGQNSGSAPRQSSKSVNDFIEESRLLSDKEQLQIIAAMSRRLAGV